MSNWKKKVPLAVAGIFALAVSVAVAVDNAPAVLAQSPSAAAPKFDVASIRLCKGGGGDSDRAGGSGGAVAGPRSTPGKLRQNCISVKRLIQEAYGGDAINNRLPKGAPVEGGPSWIDSDRYTIEAEAEGAPNPRMMQGRMMQRLLEERLQLKIHRETREIPIYILTVAKGGPKLKPSQEGSCRQHVPETADPAPNEKPWCGLIGMRRRRSGPNITWDVVGVKFADFAQFFGFILDRPLVDKAGITGTFDIHLEFAPDESTSNVSNPFGRDDSSPRDVPPDPTGGTSMFTAFQEQLGLKLVPDKGEGEFLVVDRIERPSDN